MGFAEPVPHRVMPPSAVAVPYTINGASSVGLQGSAFFGQELTTAPHEYFARIQTLVPSIYDDLIRGYILD